MGRFPHSRSGRGRPAGKLIQQPAERPLQLWYRGRSAVRDFVSAIPLAGEAAGRWHLHPIRVNGLPGFALYTRSEPTGGYQSYAIQTLSCQDAVLAEVITFGYPQLFRYFGLPAEPHI